MNKYFLLCIGVLMSFSQSFSKETVLDSDYSDWHFSIGRQRQQYLAIVPGSNINDLVCNQLIKQPYYNNAIDESKWVEDSSFTYTTIFDFQTSNTQNYSIRFEGLDTYAEVYLNNQLILKGNNMFCTYEHDVSSLLRDGSNILKITFKSVVEVGKHLAKQSSIIYPADSEEDLLKISPFIRKAAFQFGWDINPRLISCGIWRPITIISKDKASIQTPIKNNQSLKPWYKLSQKKDEFGTSFGFVTNDKKETPVFMYGSNYVPYNMYPLPLKTYTRTAHLQKNQGLPNRNDYYRNLLLQMKNYGMNMIRVWGGGWYEDDYFYDLADSLHIAVWQDFMFANTMYPMSEDWKTSVQQELNDNIKRLSKHPCIALWCGNNEIEVAWKNWGWQKKYKYSKADSTLLINDYNLLFTDIIPVQLAQQNNTVQYISSSPISNWGNESDFKTGDNHYWGVWHGEKPVTDYYKHIPRFASEYGLPSLPNYSTLVKYSSDSLNITSSNFLFQNRMKSYKGIGLLNNYIAAYFKPSKNIESYCYFSQLTQLNALKTAYAAQAFQQPYCSGSLFWQFNESWPGITWSVIDFEGNPKVPTYQSLFIVAETKPGIYSIAYNPLFNEQKATTLKINIEVKNFEAQILDSKTILFSNQKNTVQNTIEPAGIFNAIDFTSAYLYLMVIDKKDTKIWDTIICVKPTKELNLKVPKYNITAINDTTIEVKSNTFAQCASVFYSKDNNCIIDRKFIDLEANKVVRLKLNKPCSIEKLSIKSVFDYQIKE